jgi:hypothetical protein
MVRPEGFGIFEKFNDFIETRTCDLPNCSIINSRKSNELFHGTDKRRKVVFQLRVQILRMCWLRLVNRPNLIDIASELRT